MMLTVEMDPRDGGRPSPDPTIYDTADQLSCWKNGILGYNHRPSQWLVELEQINRANSIWWHFKVHRIAPSEFRQIDTVPSPIGSEHG